MKQPMRAFGAFVMGALALSYAALASADADAVKASLQAKMPHLQIDSVAPSKIAGVYEVVFDGANVVYVSEDVNHVLDGSLMELATGRNLTQQRREELITARYENMGKAWVGTLRDFGEERYLNYAGNPEGELAGREMYVFTDITCPFCARFHQQVDKLNAAGITVRYVLFARAGIDSQPHRDHISIWCADDPQQALTDGKQGRSVMPAECEHPVDQHMALRQQVEVNATPTIVLDSGERIDGFRPADSFIAQVKAKPALQ